MSRRWVLAIVSCCGLLVACPKTGSYSGPAGSASWKDFVDAWPSRVLTGQGSAEALDAYRQARTDPSEEGFAACVDLATKASDDWGRALCELVAVDEFGDAIAIATAARWTDDGQGRVGRLCGFGSPAYAFALQVRAEYLLEKRDVDAANGVLRTVAGIQARALPAIHPDVASTWLTMGAVDTHYVGKEAALHSLGRALSIRDRVFGPDSEPSMNVLLWRAGVEDDPARAEDLARARSIARTVFPDGDWRRLRALLGAAEADGDVAPAVRSVIDATPAMRRDAPHAAERILARASSVAVAGGELALAREVEALRRPAGSVPVAVPDAGGELDADTIGLAVRWLDARHPSLPRSGVIGVAVVIAHVDVDGGVVAADPVSGDPILVEAAKDAVLHWRARPLHVDGQPVRARTRVAIRFQ